VLLPARSYAPYRIDTDARVTDATSLNKTASERSAGGASEQPVVCWHPAFFLPCCLLCHVLPTLDKGRLPTRTTSLTFTALHLLPPHRADYIAGNLSTAAAANGNQVWAEQAAVMLQACSAEMVPKPPVSFNPITACVTQVMNSLNITTYA